MKDFRTRVDIQTRFRDTDAMGHINNAVYLSYLESARLEYMRQVFGITRYGDVNFILARAEIDYRSPAFCGEVLSVGVRVSRLGGASFTMDYRIEEKATGRLVAEGRSVQVAYDYKSGKVQRLAPQFIETARRHDGLP